MKRLLSTITAIIVSILSALAMTGHFISSNQFSSGLIADICQDRQGYIWIATDYGVNRYDGYHFQTFLHDKADSTSLLTNVAVSLLCDREGRLWVGTNKGLCRFDAATESFVRYRFPDGVMPRVTSMLQRTDGTLLVGTAGYGAFSLGSDDRLERFSTRSANNYFSQIFEDSRGRLWRSGFDDVISMREGTKVKDFLSPKGNPQGFVELDDCLLILCQHGFMSFCNGVLAEADIDMSIVSGKDVIFTKIASDADGNIYIGTRGQGIYRISSARPHRLEPANINVFGLNQSTAKISAAMFDRDGNFWMGCHRKGLILVPQKPMQFVSWSFEGQGLQLGSTISSVCEGDAGIVWCTVQGVGVYGFNSQGRVVAHPTAPQAVEFIFRDRLQRYWVGTDDGLFAYDPATGRYRQMVTFDCDKFNDMTSDDEGNIYISTFSRGFCVYNPKTESLRNYNMNENDSVKGRLCNNWVMGMTSDEKGLIWLATSSGISCFDPHTASFRSQGWDVQLDGIVCFDVCELRKNQLPDGRQLNGCIAIGTENGLYLYDPKKRTVERFPGSELLENKAISYIVQSNDGDIWCSTSQGIWQYAVGTATFIGHVNGNGLIHHEYLYGVGMHTDNDFVYFGHNDGLTVFQPKDIKESKADATPLYLTSFRVGDQYVHAGTVLNDVEVTGKAIAESDHFTLSYLDHTITLSFSQLKFDNPANVTYEYRVNNGDWVRNTEGKNEFTLGHLQPGNYRIEVRAQQGKDYTPEKVIMVNIRSPWYKSTTAYIIYLLLALTLLAFTAWSYRRRANRQLNEEKMRFLINATHDIRSPLTLILAALKKLDVNPAVETIDHNAKRILNLVNQILDVRKIDKQQMQLHCQKTEFITFVSGISKMFEYNAVERNINFSFVHEGIDTLEAWVDRNQFDKVITNLLSNAFKYTPDGGEITIEVKETTKAAEKDSGKEPQKCLTFAVADSGMGLDEDSLKHIFDRFYQGDNSRKMGITGTGIGLNLCKMIVEMHHGTIEAANRMFSDNGDSSEDKQKTGAVFTVTLPLGNEHLKPEEMDDDDSMPDINAGQAAAGSGKAWGSTQKRKVLIVDDDEEIGNYISTELSHYYKFNICHNGKEGIKELLTRGDYDLVVSDVMMPEMDGFTMLRMIKTNLNISHIPVIMLTSKAEVENRLEGLENGADAFLAKPFEMEELHLTIDNLIQNRQRLKGKFSGAQQQVDKLEQPEVKGNDEQLMERIMKAVNKNLSDSDFNVEMLTQEVGISRAQLHRKMKDMTGLSTSEFIRNIRLEQAARLLKEQKINVTQVAYTVGFSNLAHFSTIFRKHFGVAPSEFAELDNGE